MSASETPLVLRAISFAAREHQHQFRKDGRTPYIAHPMRVMTVLSQVFGVHEERLLAAAALHDTIEDTTADHDDLSERFGPEIADWVAALSKDKRLPEEERERRYHETLEAASAEVKLCKLADVYDNLLDAADLSVERRRNKIEQARDLLARFSPGFPERWRGALDRLRELVETIAE